MIHSLNLEMCKRLLLAYILLTVCFPIFSQDYSTVHPSPNIGWELASIKQDNNLYTGTAGIQIPIYDLTVGKTKLPISLNYNCKSIQVDQLPSWIGLGWNLNSGGQISRVVNGKPDELRETISFTTTLTVITDGFANSSSATTQVLTDNDFAYLNNYTRLNNANWSTYTYLFNTLNTLPTFEVQRNVSTVIDEDWGTTTTQLAYIPDLTRNYDFEPDEFDFSVGEIAGKFYLDHQGYWKCETNRGNFLVEPLMITGVMKNGVEIPRFIYGFKLTGPDGTKYYFGGSLDNYLKNIEYWRGPAGNQNGSNFFNIWGNAYLSVCPSAWYLTKIETIDNYVIDFIYKQGALQLMYSDAPWGQGTNAALGIYDIGTIHQSLCEPWYLSQIICSNGISVQINSQDSHQLSTDLNIGNLSPYSTFTSYADIVGVINANNNLQKVTSITISYNSDIKKKFDFGYIENLNERLKLSSITETPIDGSTYSKQYKLIYNPGLLPNYGSGLVDHFGYFNNKKFFTSSTQQIYNITRADFENQYYSSREPDYSYAKSETLDKVYFPTGGYRQFVYEPNDYSVQIKRWPFATEPAGGNKTTGGIRIAKIIDYTGDGVQANETSFIYKTEIDGTISSGVFSIPRPKYTDDRSDGGYDFSTRSFIPFDRIQSHITYSTVFEKHLDGSYIKLVHSNYDNTANNAAPFYETPTPAFWDGIPFTDNAFKRGFLKNVIKYNSSGDAVEKTSYKYQDEYDNYSRFIRSVRIKEGDQSTGAGFRVAAYPQYFFPNVMREEIDQIKSTSTSDYLTNETYLTFDNYNNLVSNKISNSKNESIITTYKYPYTFSTSDQNNPYTQLVSKNSVNNIIEELSVLNKNGQDYVIKGAINEYSSLDGPLFFPKIINKLYIGSPVLLNSIRTTAYNSSQGILSKDPKYQVLTSTKYDNNGNVLRINKTNDIFNSYQWDYSQNYLTAHVINAANNLTVSDVQQDITIQGGATLISNVGGTVSRTFNDIVVTRTGDVIIKIGGAAGVNVTYSFSFDMNTFYYTIPPNTPCGSHIEHTYHNVSPGTYSLSATATYSQTFGVCFDFYYPGSQTGQQTSGTKEFFYEGFEETGNASSIPYAGRKYYEGDFIVPYQTPNSRSYKIEYHYLSNDIWYPITKSFINNMILSEGTAIDEVRIYPTDAQMTTYTYEPLIGLTSESDINNRITKYDYDGLSRLSLIKDQDGNIRKKFEYAYQSGNPNGGTACDDDNSDGFGNCTGVDEKCINGFCEKAKRINTSTVLITSGADVDKWRCRYYYLWSSNGTTMPADAISNKTRLTQVNEFPCDVTP